MDRQIDGDPANMMERWFGQMFAVVLITSAAYVTGEVLGVLPLALLYLAMGGLTWVAPDEATLLSVALGALGRSPISGIMPFQLFVEVKVALALVFSFVWLFKAHLGKSMSPIPNWLTMVILGWGILGSFSVFHSQEPSYSFLHLSTCIAALAIFYVVWRSDADMHKRVVGVALLCAAGVGAITFLQWASLKFRVLTSLWPFILAPRERLFLQIDWSPLGDHFFRSSGTFPHPNTLGVYCYMIIPFVAALITVHGLSRWGRFVMKGLFALMLFGLYAANCRAGVIAIIISLGYLSVHKECQWLIRLGLASLLIGATAYAMDPTGVTNYFQTVGRTGTGISSRGMIWENAGRLFKRNPLFGLGPGQFTDHYNNDFGLFIFDNANEIIEQASLLQIERDDVVRGYHAHNTPLQLICEYGIFALPLFLAGIIGVIVTAERKARASPVGSFGRAMAMASAAFCLSYLVASFFDSYVAFTTVGLIFICGPFLAVGLRGAHAYAV